MTDIVGLVGGRASSLEEHLLHLLRKALFWGQAGKEGELDKDRKEKKGRQ